MWGRPSERYAGPARQAPSAQLIWEPALDLVDHGSVLDVGCGAGHVAELCAVRGIPYHGIDVSETAIIHARARAPRAALERMAPSEIRERVAVAEYDVALLLEVLEHVYEDRELLSSVPAARRVVFSVPNFHTEGHCRWFADSAEVTERYGDLVEIGAITIRTAGKNAWFICSGFRKDPA
jgi:cyclopropane fatty-acyl-phospholipid synthase-like methyltransferase